MKTQMKIAGTVAALALTSQMASAALMHYYTFDVADGFNDTEGINHGTHNNHSTTSGIATTAGDFVVGGGAFSTPTINMGDDVSLTTNIAFATETEWSVSFHARKALLGGSGAGDAMIVGSDASINDFIWLPGTGLTFRSTNGVNTTFAFTHDTDWHHYALTVGDADAGGVANDVTLYRDGALAGVVNNVTNTQFNINNIGNPYNDDTQGHSNGIDDLKIYNHAIVIPEPSSTALLGLGGLALILRRRK